MLNCGRIGHVCHSVSECAWICVHLWYMDTPVGYFTQCSQNRACSGNWGVGRKVARLLKNCELPTTNRVFPYRGFTGGYGGMGAPSLIIINILYIKSM